MEALAEADLDAVAVAQVDLVAVAAEDLAVAQDRADSIDPLITIITVPTSVGALVRAAFTAEAAVAQAR